jgi:hypothetical protein
MKIECINNDISPKAFEHMRVFERTEHNSANFANTTLNPLIYANPCCVFLKSSRGIPIPSEQPGPQNYRRLPTGRRNTAVLEAGGVAFLALEVEAGGVTLLALALEVEAGGGGQGQDSPGPLRSVRQGRRQSLRVRLPQRGFCGGRRARRRVRGRGGF